jgi:hypothetical protein
MMVSIAGTSTAEDRRGGDSPLVRFRVRGGDVSGWRRMFAQGRSKEGGDAGEMVAESNAVPDPLARRLL